MGKPWWWLRVAKLFCQLHSRPSRCVFRSNTKIIVFSTVDSEINSEFNSDNRSFSYLSAIEKLRTSFCLSLIKTDVGFCRFQRSGRFFSCDGVLGVPILVEANLLIRLLTVRLTVRWRCKTVAAELFAESIQVFTDFGCPFDVVSKGHFVSEQFWSQSWKSAIRIRSFEDFFRRAYVVPLRTRFSRESSFREMCDVVIAVSSARNSLSSEWLTSSVDRFICLHCHKASLKSLSRTWFSRSRVKFLKRVSLRRFLSVLWFWIFRWAISIKHLKW